MKYFLILITLLLLFVNIYSQPLQYPHPRKVEQVDNYFGTQVADPYRWLENDTAKEVAEWVQAENKVTFGYLKKIPYRDKIKERLTKIWNYPKYTSPYRQGTNYFFSKNDGLQNQSVMYIQSSLDAQPEVFFDPNKLSSDGTVSLGGAAFSKDGKTFAYAISRSGSDWREIYTMDVATKKKLTDSLRWAKFTGIAWYKDGFYYSRYDAPAETSKALSNKNEYHKIYYHKLGAQQNDDILIYEDKEHPLRLLGASTTEDERYLFLTASQGGDRGNSLSFMDLQSDNRKFIPVTESFDDQFNPVDNIGDQLLIFTQKNAPNGKIILVDTKNPDEQHWKEFIGEKPEVLNSVTTCGGKIFVTYMKDVAPRVYVYNTDGKMENEIPLPILGTVGGFGGNHDDTFTFFSMTSFTTPATIYKYDIATKSVTLFRKPEIDFDSDNYITEQVFYTSNDGTRIPMFLVHKKGISLDGSNPTWLYGYGGFNIGMFPSFNPARLIWLEQGGVYAVANIRGGSEYGEKWHEAGTKLKKQNVFDDFIAAAEYLIGQKYTTSEKLVIQGGSNGGLLIGAVINQRPELCRVALPAVGVMDMLRFQKFTIGWSWTNDYGSSDDSVQFKNLYTFSPLQNIREGLNYPSILATTADHDDRVVPAHTFKYIATMQEKYHGNNPVLVRIETKAGHGGGKPTSKIIEETADLNAFTFYNLGITPKY